MRASDSRIETVPPPPPPPLDCGALAGGALTTRLVDAFAVPPVPEQEIEKLCVPALAKVTLVEPLVVWEPDHAPPAVHVVACAAVHVSAAACPVTTAVGPTEIATVGSGATVSIAVAEALPPGPVQVSVYVGAPAAAAVTT